VIRRNSAVLTQSAMKTICVGLKYTHTWRYYFHVDSMRKKRGELKMEKLTIRQNYNEGVELVKGGN